MAPPEFAYDPLLGPRARYLAADYDPASGNDPNTWTPIEPMSWTDYDSLLPCADLELAADGEGGWELTGVRRYFGTVGDESRGWGGQPLTRRVYHQDMLGSTALVTDETATPAVPPAGVGSVAYTAFGELLCGRGGEPPGAGDPEGCEVGSPGGTVPEGFPRYQYDGAWGYESGLLALGGVNQRLAAIRLLHVGWRWYQPDIGRFIQRDPLGIYAGLNCHTYVGNSPTRDGDPWGLQDAGFCPYCGVKCGHARWCPRHHERWKPRPPDPWPPHIRFRKKPPWILKPEETLILIAVGIPAGLFSDLVIDLTGLPLYGPEPLRGEWFFCTEAIIEIIKALWRDDD